MERKVTLTHIVFLLYLLIMAWIILFKTAFSMADVKMLVGERSANFIPFYYDNEPNVRYHAKEIILNILIFVPFGVCLRMLGNTLKKGAIIAVISTIALEVVQFLFAIGRADITDVLTNTFGAIVGLFLYLLAAKIFKNEKKLEKVTNIIALVLLSIFIALFVLLIIANS